tara:strand:+ start:1402 stop:1575 length:174 start_codon:yes stop_codon:yes gene_type:complete
MRLNDLNDRIVIIEEKRTPLKNGKVQIENLYQDGFVEKYTYRPNKKLQKIMKELGLN